MITRPERVTVRDQYDQPRTRDRVRRGDSVVIRRENRRGGRHKRQYDRNCESGGAGIRNLFEDADWVFRELAVTWRFYAHNETGFRQY
jgi:hypothetical protein